MRGQNNKINIKMYLKITSKIKNYNLTYLVYFLTNWSADKS
jgi:hypothetical protein